MVRRALLAMMLLGVGVAACGGDTRPRCSECGMYADVAPAFAAYARGSDGHELRFDAPRCLFRYLASPNGRGATRPEVTEHYSQTRVAAETVVFVVGSDVTGPMGRDLIPVARDHSAQFVADHHGRVVERAAIDSALLRALDP